MRPLSEAELRAAFVNASDQEREAIATPLKVVVSGWEHLDFLAWADPDLRGRGYIVAERAGEPVGIVLRAAAGNRSHASLCNLCHTMQPGNQVSLFTARRAGSAAGDSIGTYVCADLGCHDNVRLAAPLAPSEIRASVDRRIDGTRRRVESFVDDVLGS